MEIENRCLWMYEKSNNPIPHTHTLHGEEAGNFQIKIQIVAQVGFDLMLVKVDAHKW